PYGYNNGPRCTPLLTKDRCYTYGAGGVLTCLDLETGKEIWRRDVKEDFDLFKESAFGDQQPNWFFGIGCTPILEDGLLITLVGGQPNSGVVAFDADTGKVVWQNVGRDEWDGAQTDWPDEPRFQWTSEEQVVSYSSPIAVTIHGKRHVLCLLRHGLVSLDPRTGEVNFKYWFRSRSFESVNAARPILAGDKIFITAAYRSGSALLEVSQDGTAVTEVWRDQRNMLAHWSTPIHVDGYIYGFSGRHEQEGEFRCIDANTGDVIWSTTGFEGEIEDLEHDPGTGEIRDRRTGRTIPWPFYGRGSKIQVGDKFIVLGERGTLALVHISPQRFEELARTTYPQLKYPCWTAPVLSRQRLYLRCEDALLCLDLAPNDMDNSSS
ncbi:MAG: PQQ-binding-like beta-propeller repeat protein, partial [Vicinamibacterales bacterium]